MCIRPRVKTFQYTININDSIRCIKMLKCTPNKLFQNKQHVILYTHIYNICILLINNYYKQWAYYFKFEY